MNPKIKQIQKKLSKSYHQHYFIVGNNGQDIIAELHSEEYDEAIKEGFQVLCDKFGYGLYDQDGDPNYNNSIDY